MTNDLPRGIRNKNPLNLRRAGSLWQGMALKQTDRDFVQFISMAYGIRAAAIVLKNYYKIHKANTIGLVITRWAPPIENDTDSYVRDVCARTGFKSSDELNLLSRRFMRPLIDAMIWHENGQNPVTDKDMDSGLTLAGVL